MKARELTTLLMAALETLCDSANCGEEEMEDIAAAMGVDATVEQFEGLRVMSFRDGGYMTGDEGFVVEFGDNHVQQGATFQVVVKRSR